MRAEYLWGEVEPESVEGLLASLRPPPRFVSEVAYFGPSALEEARSLMNSLLTHAERCPDAFTLGKALPAIDCFARVAKCRLGVTLEQLGTSRFKLFRQIRRVAPRVASE